VFSNVYRLSFLIDGDDEENSFVVGKSAWLLRSIFGFVVNLVLRDFVGYSVPILLMNFHNPIDCVIYSVARSNIEQLNNQRFLTGSFRSAIVLGRCERPYRTDVCLVLDGPTRFWRIFSYFFPFFGDCLADVGGRSQLKSMPKGLTCRVYGTSEVAVNFIVTLDDTPTQLYKASCTVSGQMAREFVYTFGPFG
jgi:hypothetical protein